MSTEREGPPSSGRDDAATLRDEDPSESEVTKLAPLTAVAAAVAGEVAHSSEVQRAAARARAETMEAAKEPPPPPSGDELDEPTRVRSAAAVPDLAFDEPPRREQTALMPGAPGRVPARSSSRMLAHPMGARGATFPVVRADPPSPVSAAAGRWPSDATIDETRRWWTLVAVFAVVAVAVPFAVYYALREDGADAPADVGPGR